MRKKVAAASPMEQPTGELALIERIRKRAAGLKSGAKSVDPAAELTLGIGDDCAILQPRPEEEIVVTTDFSLEGRHFRRDWHPAASIGHRALARGLSDIAAMGGRPVTAFLSLALPRSVAKDTRWIDSFLKGMLALAKDYGITLAGGDTSEAPGEEVLADIVLIGATPTGTALRRSGAQPGHLLYCTGTLGGSAQELNALSRQPGLFQQAKRGKALSPHLYPEPRVAVGLALRERGLATACMDLSDGLSTDLAHLCHASGVAAEVDFARLPKAANLRGATKDTVAHCMLHGGEDYELLFTAGLETKMPKKIAGVRVTRIGRVMTPKANGPQVALIHANGTRTSLAPAGWEHLRG